MFENLNNENLESANNANPQAGQSPQQPVKQSMPNQSEVDDIFAETDKVNEGDLNKQPVNKNSEIVTKHVGLGSSHGSMPNEDNDDHKKGGKAFKIIVIVMVVIIVGLLSFLAYSKFFNNEAGTEAEQNMNTQSENTNSDEVNQPENMNTENDNQNADEMAQEGENTPSKYVDLNPGEEEPELDGSFTEAGNNEGNNVNSQEDTARVPADSDRDGLSDEKELTYGTNPVMEDSDNDGLSDYEEVRIYGSDPVKADTDGDGYLDGQEIENGYDPSGDGKLSDR